MKSIRSLFAATLFATALPALVIVVGIVFTYSAAGLYGVAVAVTAGDVTVPGHHKTTVGHRFDGRQVAEFTGDCARECVQVEVEKFKF